tara:strand:- start:17 stop:235 length:219 start_codon:yes stop_codon:yes gene_type:complete
VAHFATPNIHAPTLREGFGVHLPIPKPALLQVEVGARVVPDEGAVVDGPPPGVSREADEDAHALHKHYSTTQ